MAGDWLKIEKITPDKPEIEAIAATLDMDPDTVFGKCFRVWRWFDDHTEDGNAPRVSKTSIDRRVGVTGFADAMETAGWLASTPEGVSLVNFDRHNGETSKGRALTAKRVAKHKAAANAKANGDSVSMVTQGALPREEKRTEEKIPPTVVNTPLPPKGEPKPQLPPSIRTPEMIEAVDSWIAYKAERREGYKPQGLKALYARIANVAAMHGPQCVIDRMERAKASGWKGWDHEEKTPTGRGSPMFGDPDDPRGNMAAGHQFLRGTT